jgi:hypothetical protein
MNAGKKIFMTGVIFFAAFDSIAQIQDIYFGASDDWFYTINKTSDNNLLMIGATSSFGAGGSDVMVAKTNKDGDTLWTKTYGGALTDLGYNFTQMSDSGYLFCAMSSSWNGGTNSDAYLIRTNSNGDTLWTNSFGGADDESFYSAAELTPGGNIIAAGFTESFGAGANDVFIVKLNANGNLIWAKAFGAFSYDFMYSMLLTSDGKILITGSTLSSGAGNNDAMVMKMDTLGNLLWTKTFGSTDVDEAYFATETPEGNYLVCGSTAFGAGNYDAWLLKLDSSGVLFWNKTYGGSAGVEDANYIVAAAGGNYILAGRTGSFGAGNDDFFLFNVDTSGSLHWAKAIGGAFNDPGYGVTFLSFDNSIFLCGSTMSFGPGVGMYTNAMFVKTDTSGNGTCHTAVANVLVSSPTPVVGNMMIQQASGTNVISTQTQVHTGLNILDACIPTGETEIENPSGVIVFPNPFQEEAEIRFTIESGQPVVLTLRDILQRKILLRELKNSPAKIQRGNLPDGIYFYELRNSNRIIAKGKLLIQD